MSEVPYIAVEGPIGIGKTSLAKAISTHFQFALLKEIVEENPFLEKFYENMEEWGFQTEMFFLCNRYKQINEIQEQFLNKRIPVVADYHIYKNLIFAKRTLNERDYQKYQQIYHILTHDAPKPNIVIYLNGRLDTLQARIEKRGRQLEKDIEPKYLQQLIKDYDVAVTEFKNENPSIPVLHVNGDDIDFVHKQEDLQQLLTRISTLLEKEFRP